METKVGQVAGRLGRNVRLFRNHFRLSLFSGQATCGRLTTKDSSMGSHILWDLDRDAHTHEVGREIMVNCWICWTSEDASLGALADMPLG